MEAQSLEVLDENNERYFLNHTWGYQYVNFFSSNNVEKCPLNNFSLRLYLYSTLLFKMRAIRLRYSPQTSGHQKPGRLTYALEVSDLKNFHPLYH